MTATWHALYNVFNNEATNPKGMNTMGKFNIYQAVTDRIIAQLEKGIIPWHKPWSGVSGAFNRVSGKSYSMLNQMLLSQEGEYATFKQWTQLGGKIKKGAKSEIVVFWKMLEVEEDNGDKKKIPLLRYINVFHISQVEGVKSVVETHDHDGIVDGDELIKDYSERADIEIVEKTGDKACYYPTIDRITVPAKNQFENVAEFYSTVFHEMVHSTGAASRLNRHAEDETDFSFGSQGYSKEELVAEIGASMLMNHLGIETEETFENSAAYIKGWLSKLKGDNKFIVSAAGKAEKAAKYILGC